MLCFALLCFGDFTVCDLRCRIEAELRRVPFEAELELCDALCSHLERQLKVHGAFQQLQQRTAAAFAPSSSGGANTDTDAGAGRALSQGAGGDGLSFKVYKKDETELRTGNPKKQKNKGRKSAMALSSPTAPDAEGKPTSEAVSHDAEKMAQFVYLKVEAAATVDAIPACIEAVQEKKAYFLTLTRDNKEVQTFAETQRAAEKKEAAAEKKEKREQDSQALAGPPGLAAGPTPAPIGKPKSATSVFTAEQLTSADLFPSLKVA